MAIICPRCSREYNTSPDFSIYYVENRQYRHRKVITGTPEDIKAKNFRVGDALEIGVTEYVIQECTKCHELMIVDEVQHSIRRAREDEEHGPTSDG